ncbi:MAG: VOC family protein [Phycisphaerales bacterium JB038]
MAESDPGPGGIEWIDLTIPNAAEVRDFYAAVADWKHGEVPMDGYSDFAMTRGSGGEPVAGICHARGMNADLPPQWLIYITVADLDASMAACQERGGTIIAGPKEMGPARYCIIQDPAGAVAALFQKG